MGHIARTFEQSGISTVAFGIMAFKSRMLPMAIPRLVITPELLGKTLGKPNDKKSQRKYLEAGFDLLENSSEGNSILIMGDEA